MSAKLRNYMSNKKIIWMVKCIVCVLIIGWLCNCIDVKGFDSYYSFRDYSYQNSFSEAIFIDNVNYIEQSFISKGNIITNIKVYFGEVYDSELLIEIIDDAGRIVYSNSINPVTYKANSWNNISLDGTKLERNKSYRLTFKGNNLGYLVFSDKNEVPGIFGNCIINGNDSAYTMALEIDGTYKYMLLGDGLELSVSLLFILFIAMALGYTVINIEKVFRCYLESESKEGILYAVYFSVYTVLLFNPLDSVRNEVSKFSRVMGMGFNAGIDVTKRTNNFMIWFISFALFFVIFLLLSNYLKKREYQGENQKAIMFLDNIIVIANVILVLRCITFFYDQSQNERLFYFSDFIIMIVIILAISYIGLGLEKKITLEKYETVIIGCWMAMFPIAITMTHEWNLGRGFMGIQVIAAILITILIKVFNFNWNSRTINCCVDVGVICFSIIPFITSLYIELVVWLNQRGIFWTHIRRNYCILIMVGVLLTICIMFICVKKDKRVKNWKAFVYPSIIFGFSCLWQQIPISATYNIDIFETANSSVLISDFLNYGDIPIIQHYGGHMMTGVWEGIIYAVLNNDVIGAAFSPYDGYIATVIVVLLYLLIKNFWNDDAAFIVALFFPSYGLIYKWGLGLLIVLSARAYIKKNSYSRALLFWLACIWCALYRLDLGFAFIIAGIIVMIIYAITEKKGIVIKQLLLTLMGCVVVGIAIWFGVCLVKGINPINRLLEFLYINLSNQNWAYTEIGDCSLTKFAITYILLPGILIIGILYTIFSNKIRKKCSIESRMMILILGFSYIYNFSRGLVRHSLVENALDICTWTALLFIALFVAMVKADRRIFLPIFTLCILLFNVLQSSNNYNENSVIDAAMSKVGNYTESWTLDRFADEEQDGNVETYWEGLADKQETVKRVRWGDDGYSNSLVSIVKNYRILIDSLIEPDETFVDFINKTAIYPLIGRQNPVYVSQSPLQLSGQFTQEEYIKEIENVPIVLMPFDNEDYRSSESLDGVPNSYRYYKISEYIYQNYKPLCTYKDQYAIWCLPDRYNEMVKKIKDLKDLEIDIVNEIKSSSQIQWVACKPEKNEDGSFSITATGLDPFILDLQNLVDVSSYINSDLRISVEYETDTIGEMQLFYTTELDEDYSESKVAVWNTADGDGIAYFEVPVSEYTRLRFDIPENASVKIKSFKLGTLDCDLVQYGYDGPYLQDNGEYVYLPYVHNYALSLLPLLWAEHDVEDSAHNPSIVKLREENGVYLYQVGAESKKNGNYLKLHLTYDGVDTNGKTDNDDEKVEAILRLGEYQNGSFDTKYIYTFTIKEGEHDYMFRVSSDYYWYSNMTNCVKLECGGELININMEILQGD